MAASEHDALFDALERSVLDGEGVVPAKVRRAVGEDPSGAAAPAAARDFVRKTHVWAPDVTDAEVAALLGAGGLTQDEVYELAAAASVGAGMARLRAARKATGR